MPTVATTQAAAGAALDTISGAGAFLFADSFDYQLFSPVETYNYGVNTQIFHDQTARTGPGYLVISPSTGNPEDFVGRDLSREVTAVAFHLALRLWNMSGAVGSRVQLCSWRAAPVTPGTGTRSATNDEQASLWLEKVSSTTARLVLVADGADQAMSTADLAIATGLSPLEWQHLILAVTLGADATSGSLAGYLEGDTATPWWTAEGVNTGTNHTGVIASVTVGHAPTSIAANADYDVDDLVVTEGVVLGPVRVELLPPNASGADQNFEVQNTGVSTQTPPADWEAVYQSAELEPDEEASRLLLTTGVGEAYEGRHSMKPSPLPDWGCAGQIIGLVPMWTSRIAPDDPGVPQLRNAGERLYLAGSAVGGTHHFGALYTVRVEDPDAEPYEGLSGYTTRDDDCFGMNPQTGAVWTADDLAALEFGVEVLDIFHDVTHAALMVILQPAVEGALWPKKNLQWRASTDVWAYANLAPRQSIGLWEMRNREWRPVFSPCEVPETTEWVDALTATTLDHRAWMTGYDAGSRVTPTVDGLEIAGPTADGAFREAEVFAHVPHGHAGFVTAVEVTGLVASHAAREGGLRWVDVGGTIGIRYRAGTLELHIDHTWVEASVAYDPVAHRWWRLRHDTATERICADGSADGVTWTEWGSSPFWWNTPVLPARVSLCAVNDGSPSDTVTPMRFRDFSATPIHRP